MKKIIQLLIKCLKIFSQNSNIKDKIGNLKAFSFTGTCDAYGYIPIPASANGCSIIYCAVTNTFNTVPTLFLNGYGTWHVRLYKSDGTVWTGGNFVVFCLGA